VAFGCINAVFLNKNEWAFRWNKIKWPKQRGDRINELTARRVSSAVIQPIVVTEGFFSMRFKSNEQ